MNSSKNYENKLMSFQQDSFKVGNTEFSISATLYVH